MVGSREIQTKWDQLYQEGRISRHRGNTHRWLTTHKRWLSGGLALEIACGRGWDAIWLAQHGYRVIATDISRRALQLARRAAHAAGIEERMIFLLSNVQEVDFLPATFDLLLGFSFWERKKAPVMKAWVKPGGLILYETLNSGWLDFRPGVNPEHVLRPGELSAWLADWEIIDQKEMMDWREEEGIRPVNGILARKPAEK